MHLEVLYDEKCNYIAFWYLSAANGVLIGQIITYALSTLNLTNFSTAIWR